MRTITINGKFFSARLEGMPRVGVEVVSALDLILDDVCAPQVEIALPRDAPPLSFRNIKIRRVGCNRGLLWEQLDLPLFSAGRCILSFTGTAPMLHRRGCVVVHDAQFVTYGHLYGREARVLYSFFTPAATRQMRSVVTVSEFSRQDIVRNIHPRSDIRVIYNGADHTDRWGRDSSIFLGAGLRPGGYVLAQATTAGHKNIRVLLEAASARPDLAHRLVLFGPSSGDSFRKAGVVVPAGVKFLGPVSDAQLGYLMENAAVFAYPSLTEGFGMPPLEAMRCGCPVIVARAGAIPEVCGDAALYADPLDAADWQRQLKYMLDDQGARRSARNAGWRRAGDFTWRKAAKAYLDTMMQISAE